jgi:DNA repair exonuclease SbcCD ATPase subunit
VISSLTFHDLRVTNWKAYRGPHTWTFQTAPGVYLIRGENILTPALGSNQVGKSTLLDALVWCFYGKTLRDEKPGATVEPHTGEKGTVVTVRFSKHGSLYTLSRGRRPNILTLAKGKLKSTAVEITQTDIDTLLGMSYMTFLCTIVLPQFGERFLDLTPERQSRLFSETMNYDRWLRASETASALARTIQKEIDDQRTVLAQAEGRVSAHQSHLDSEQTASRRFSQEAATRLKELLAQHIRAAKAEKSGQRASVKKTHALPTDDELIACQETIAKLRATLREQDTEITDATALLSTLDDNADRIQQEIQKYKKYPTKCPECGQAVPRSHIARHLQERQKELQELEQVRDDAFALKVNLQNEADRLSHQISEKTTTLDNTLLMMRRAQADV